MNCFTVCRSISFLVIERRLSKVCFVPNHKDLIHVAKLSDGSVTSLIWFSFLKLTMSKGVIPFTPISLPMDKAIWRRARYRHTGQFWWSLTFHRVSYLVSCRPATSRRLWRGHHGTPLLCLYLFLHSDVVTISVSRHTQCWTDLLSPAIKLLHGRLKETALDQSTHRPLCWLCCVDRIFVIWPHRPEKLEEFLHHHILLFPH